MKCIDSDWCQRVGHLPTTAVICKPLPVCVRVVAGSLSQNSLDTDCLPWGSWCRSLEDVAHLTSGQPVGYLILRVRVVSYGKETEKSLQKFDTKEKSQTPWSHIFIFWIVYLPWYCFCIFNFNYLIFSLLQILKASNKKVCWIKKKKKNKKRMSMPVVRILVHDYSTIIKK